MNPAKFQSFIKSGIISVQDDSAGLVATLANPQKKHVVFDLCSAPGGKTVHLAELGNDNLSIIAGDINKARIQLVKGAAQRLKLKSVIPVVADGMNFPAQAADIVLLDAPCSGLGVLRKKPDLRWNRQLEDLKSLLNLQYEMLSAAARLLKPGGQLIYSTCTIDLDENEGTIGRFLNQHPDFIKNQPDPDRIPVDFITDQNTIRTWPHLHNMDGSFAVKLTKIGN